MSVTNIFDLDMNQKSVDEYYAFFVNKTDYQSRTVQANLYITYTKGGSRIAYNLTDETVTISYEYTDENGNLTETYEFSCTKATSIGNNVITFVIPNVAVENVGSVKAQVKIYEDVSTVLNSVLFSFYVNNSLSVGLTPDIELPLLYVAPIIGSVAPTDSTVGLLGQLYVEDVGKNLYYCSDVTGSVYTWTIVSGGTLVSVINSLTSTSTTDALSAAQGKILEDSKIAKSLYDANTILYATTDNTPVALTVGEQTLVGRKTGGNISTLAIDSDLSSVSTNDDTLPSAKATKAALDGKVDKSTYDAHTILYAASDNTPVALTVTEQTVIGRVTGGNISAILIDSDLSSVSTNDDSVPSAKATKAALDGKATSAQGAKADTAIQLSDLLSKIYPVGSIYERTVNISPASFLGGTWATLAPGRVLIGVDSDDADYNAARMTGGNKNITGTANGNYVYDPSGTNGWLQSSGAVGVAYLPPAYKTNLQPYYTVYRWERIA